MDAVGLVEKLNEIKAVKKAFASNKAFHAYIVQGEKTICMAAMRLLSAYALCKQGACGHCIDCINAIKGIHIDGLSYPKEKATLSVDEISEANFECNIAPRISQNKVLILSTFGQKFQLDWQNKLLKTLEEPPKNVYIFIGTDNAQKLLSTVRSRCELVEIKRLSDEQIAQHLCRQGYDQKDAQIAAALAQGDIALAQTAIASAETQGMAQAVFDAFVQMKNTSCALTHIAALSAYEASARQLFAFMQTVVYEAYLFSTTGRQRLFSCFSQTLALICENYSDEALLRAVELIDGSASAVSWGVSFTSTLDNLILKILEVKQKCRL